jgi:hypothetical protein
MADSEQDKQKLLAAWENVAKRMDQLRRCELENVDVARAIEALDDAFESARQHMKPSTTSGLVAQQAWFMKGSK